MKYLRNLFKRDKIVIVLVIISASLGVFGIPQRFGFTTEKLILAILAVIAFDILIEKLGYLEDIEDGVKTIISSLAHPGQADSVFKSRSNMPSFETLLQQCDEIWIAGKSLSNFIGTHGKQIEKSAHNGTKFRCLIHNPQNSILMEALASNSFSNPDAKTIKNLVNSGLLQLKRIKDSCPPGHVDIRLVNSILPNGFTIVDGQKEDAVMYVELFSYKISLGDRLSIFINRKRDPKTFSFYIQQFENLWRDSKQIA